MITLKDLLKEAKVVLSVIGLVVVLWVCWKGYLWMKNIFYYSEYRPGRVITPPPECTPQTGKGYIVTNSILGSRGTHYWTFRGPPFENEHVKRVAPGLPVEILEAKWVSHAESCYFYRLRLPDGEDQVWVSQDVLTVEKGIPISKECVCSPRQYPDHPPATGWLYTYVESGYGVILFRDEKMSQEEHNNPVLSSGIKVEILEAFWIERYSTKIINCYQYHVRDPITGYEGWTTEEFFSLDSESIPERQCIAAQERGRFVMKLDSDQP